MNSKKFVLKKEPVITQITKKWIVSQLESCTQTRHLCDNSEVYEMTKDDVRYVFYPYNTSDTIILELDSNDGLYAAVIGDYILDYGDGYVMVMIEDVFNHLYELI